MMSGGIINRTVGLGWLSRRMKRMDGYSMMELVLVIILATVAMPGIVGMYTSVLRNSQKAEMYAIAEQLAIEQMEIILADKAGTGVGYGYANINTAKYAGVNPTGNFSAFSRTVNIQILGAGNPYERKEIRVTVSHSLIRSVVLTAWVYDHTGL